MTQMDQSSEIVKELVLALIHEKALRLVPSNTSRPEEINRFALEQVKEAYKEIYTAVKELNCTSNLKGRFS